MALLRRLAVFLLGIALVALCGCAKAPVSQPSAEKPETAARRILTAILGEGSDPVVPVPYGQNAQMGEPQAILEGYFPVGLPVDWVVSDDRRAARSGLFDAMRPAPRSKERYLVPILENGEPVSEFEIYMQDGEWVEGARLAEERPAGVFHEIAAIEKRLRARLGDGSTTRVALLLPSGLVFVAASDGEEELAAYLSFENAGPGIKGFDKYLPQTGDLYDSRALEGLLDPSGPSPVPVDQ